jgi:hypothetical protein
MSKLEFRRVAKTVGAAASDVTENDFYLLTRGKWPSSHVHPDLYGAIISLVHEDGWEEEYKEQGYSLLFIELCQEALDAGAEFLIIDVDEAPVREIQSEGKNGH